MSSEWHKYGTLLNPWCVNLILWDKEWQDRPCVQSLVASVSRIMVLSQLSWVLTVNFLCFIFWNVKKLVLPNILAFISRLWKLILLWKESFKFEIWGPYSSALKSLTVPSILIAGISIMGHLFVINVRGMQKEKLLEPLRGNVVTQNFVLESIRPQKWVVPIDKMTVGSFNKADKWQF